MKTKNSCYTYFAIKGDFDPDIVSKRLGLEPDNSWKKGELRKNGSKYDFSCWEYGRCDEYDVFTENQMRKTIAGLLDKVEELNNIRNDYDVSFVLEIVPSIYVGDTNPCLAPSLDIIDFCHATRTHIDIDYYLYEKDDD